ncbi:MAG: DEAD/DEAH box helicase [Candidatus Lokiarchaeota archaeon]|nr:DEAD/DEAH box helicase [Candidatus Lokiarchaeota archaeon]
MLPQDPFFIVLDVTGTKDGIVDCNLIVYPVMTDGKGGRVIIQKPLHLYNCQFSDQADGDEMGQNGGPGAEKLRPFRIWEPPRGNERDVKTYYDQKLLKRLIKEARFTIVPGDVPDKRLRGIVDMYKDLQLEGIRRATFCSLCRTRASRYIALHDAEAIPLVKEANLYACESCGWNVLLSRLEMKGVKITAGLQEILSVKFKKIRNIEKIERTFDPNWNPIEDADYSLYDVCDLVREPFAPVKVAAVAVDPRLKDSLLRQGIEDLLPVQVKALKAGLLDGKNMLVASSTSSGKTLIGEIAGINNILAKRGGMFIFVVPLVALANQKHQEFKKRYGEIGIKVSLRVGKSRIDKSIDTNTRSASLKGADILVGTYEGVDYLLRAGKSSALPRVSTIVIDEIQMFKDEERGVRLDGFISRMKFLFPDAQVVYLSATVAAPRKLARMLGAAIVEYNERPVPIERHLIPCLNEAEKVKIIGWLVRKEYRKASSFGFKGQSIVFTNSRRTVHDLVDVLRLDGIQADAYHSGLTYGERVRVERRFEKQQVAAVVTTAALGAGVDLPASQVIFHSLAMGIEWLTVAEFNQMLGRAGRFQKHDMGKVYLLVEPGKSYHASQQGEEDKIALRLLNGTLQESMPAFDLDKIAAEVLAFVAMRGDTTLDEVTRYHGALLTKAVSVVKLLNHLHKSELISVTDKGAKIAILPVGRAITESFLSIEDGLKLKRAVLDYEESVIDIASSLNPLKNVYVTDAIVSEMSRYKSGHSAISSKFFGGQILDFMTLEQGQFSGTALKRKKMSRFAIEILSRWALDIFTCECDEKPYCDHGVQSLARIMVRLRRQKRLEPHQISQHLRETYQIQVYTGDVYEFLDSILHALDAIQRFARIFKNEKMLGAVTRYRSSIEDPSAVQAGAGGGKPEGKD